MKKVTAGGVDILLANVDGTFRAIGNKCPHAGGSLADGTLTGNTVTCPRHKGQFDLTTGKVVGKSQVLFFRVTPKDAKTYTIRLEGQDILVDIS
jgi:nitrite reductase/ring-hydroxylating ferredoxin subunit